MTNTVLEFIDYNEIKAHEVSAETPLQGINLHQFIANINTAFEVLQKDIDFYPAYPESVLYYETHADRFRNTITWNVKHLSPQQLGGKSSPNPDSGTREVKPRLREIVKHSDGREYAIYGQLFQAFIQFDVWSTTGSEAESIAYWFQNDFMAHFGSVLGSQHVRFYERRQDRDLLKINNRLQTRSLIYYALLDENTVKPVDLIARIRTRIQQSD